MTEYFRVRNFERFQHYKDRSPVWIKLYNDLLDNYEHASLPDASKAHLHAIWLLASRSNNRLPADPKWLAGRIGATEPVDLSILQSAGFIEPAPRENSTISDSTDSRSELLAETEQVSIPEGETETETETVPNGTGALAEQFENWWAEFPRRRRGAKGPARKKWLSLVKRGKATPEDLVAGLERYNAAGYRDSEFAKGAEGWLNGEYWTIDEFAPPGDSKENRNGKRGNRGAADPEAAERERRAAIYDTIRDDIEREGVGGDGEGAADERGDSDAAAGDSRRLAGPDRGVGAVDPAGEREGVRGGDGPAAVVRADLRPSDGGPEIGGGFLPRDAGGPAGGPADASGGAGDPGTSVSPPAEAIGDPGPRRGGPSAAGEQPVDGAHLSGEIDLTVPAFLRKTA